MANQKPKKNHPQVDRDSGKQTRKEVQNQDSKQDHIDKRGYVVRVFYSEGGQTCLPLFFKRRMDYAKKRSTTDL